MSIIIVVEREGVRDTPLGMKEMKEKLVSYEEVESFILNQVNEIHMYRMVYFKELRNERDWEYYLHDSMDDGYNLIHKAINNYLFSGCPEEFTNEVMNWYHTSLEMLGDFRRLLLIKYNKKYIRSTIKAFTKSYNENYEMALKNLL